MPGIPLLPPGPQIRPPDAHASGGERHPQALLADAQRFLGLLAFVDVGDRADPLADDAVAVADRYAALAHPAMPAARGVVDAVFERDRIAGAMGLGPGRGSHGTVVGVDHRKPAGSDVLRRRLSRVALPERRLVHAAARRATPLDRRGGLDQRPIALFADAVGLFDPPALVDVAKRSDAAEGRARRIEIDASGRRHPALDAVIRPDDAEFGLVGSVLGRCIGPPIELVHPVAIGGMDERREQLAVGLRFRRQPADRPELRRPLPLAGSDVHVPDADPGGGDGEPQALLALPQFIGVRRGAAFEIAGRKFVHRRAPSGYGRELRRA